MNDLTATEKTREQLSALASHLDAKRDALLKRWRKATEGAREMTIAFSLTRLQFNDHIPGVLDAYTHKLRAWPRKESVRAQSEEKAKVIEHGLQRWQQGYQLRELTREWGHLQMCMIEELEDFALAHPDLEPATMATARLAWSQLCSDGISDSTTQYWRLHQAEAAGHVRDLEQALATLNELDQNRAAAWRETAHDLRGTLSLVTLATSILDRKNLPAPKRHEFSDLVQRGVASLHELLDDFMSLARLDAGLEQRKNASFDAAVLLADFCATSQPLAQARGLFLKTDGPDSLPVEGDSTKIQRILQNLLLNSLKYTQRGGVTVLWKPVKDRDTNNWMFCVQDTGLGLDAGLRAPLAREIHEATQTAHTAKGAHREDKTEADITSAPTLPTQSEALPSSRMPGEGVGLSIVKRLCELLDASLELETSPGKGSTFRVILPSRYNDGVK